MERPGWTKRHRIRWDKGYHTDLLLWVMMDYFIDHANYKDREWFDGTEKVAIRRGQCVYSQPNLAKFFGVGRQQIRTRLAILENIGFLTNQSTKQYSIATICNYCKYQGDDQQSQPSNQPTGNQHLTTLKEENKNNKNKPPSSSQPDEGSDAYQLSEYLKSWILKNNPKARPKSKNWTIEIDRMIRIDGRTPDEIRRVIDFCQGDSFWRSNILSAKTLREKFDQLYMKIGESGCSSSTGCRRTDSNLRAAKAFIYNDSRDAFGGLPKDTGQSILIGGRDG